MDLGPWGVDEGYWDVDGQWHEPPPETVEAFRRVMTTGAPADATSPPSGPPLWFVQSGTGPYLKGPADLVLEDGTALRVPDVLPADLPPGYHDLHPLDGGPMTRLVVTPGRCHLPDALRTWGLAVQLYAARSKESWGIGDLGDLRRLAAWSASLGAGVLSVSPLHVPGPAHPVDPSPYHPSSRRFLNPLHLSVEDVPGAVGHPEVERLAAVGRALDRDRRIDRDAVWSAKRTALEEAFRRRRADGELDRFVAGRPDVVRWATFCAIADLHGNDWRRWPTELRRPGGPAVARLAADRAEQLRFHAWLQRELDRQLAVVGRTIGVVQDLAVGFDPGGADGWEFQDQLALDVQVGVPPDRFNTAGQVWGLPPFVPWRLRAARYGPFVETVRAAFRHAGGLRVDHVMGLFRLFWVPDGVSPAAGAYVRSAAGELLDILALESHRAKAFVVGEDLGTVEDSVRSELADRGVLSYRLLWFEDRPPDQWPEHALAAVTTHDLPTVAGLWRRTDPATADMGMARERLAPSSATDGDGDVDGSHDGADEPSLRDVLVDVHRRLGASPCRVVAVTLDDLEAVEERPNLPGTDDVTNWSLALPRPIEALEDDPTALAVLDAVAAQR